MKAFPDEQSCINHLEWVRWDGNVVSPFDPSSQVYKCASNKYKCKSTGKYFNVRTATIFEGSKIPLQQWFLAIYLFVSHKKGISSHQMAKDLSITQKSAWFLLSRIRYAMEHESFLKEMSGSVQIDETFVGGKNKNRHKDKKVPYSSGRAFKDKTPIVGFLDDRGIVRCVVVPDTKASTLQPIVRKVIKSDSILITDEWLGYRGLSESYWHEVVDHGRKQYQNDNGFSSNGIENFWSHLKRGIIGVYHKASRKHLQNYANEFTFRFNVRNEGIFNAFNLFLQTANTRRLRYQTLIA